MPFICAIGDRSVVDIAWMEEFDHCHPYQIPVTPLVTEDISLGNNSAVVVVVVVILITILLSLAYKLCYVNSQESYEEEAEGNPPAKKERLNEVRDTQP